MGPGTARAHLAAASTDICRPVPVNARYSPTGPAGSLRNGSGCARPSPRSFPISSMGAISKPGADREPAAPLHRGGRVGLNSVSVPIDGFPANYLH